jgi:hypothetical protein
MRTAKRRHRSRRVGRVFRLRSKASLAFFRGSSEVSRTNRPTPSRVRACVYRRRAVTATERVPVRRRPRCRPLPPTTTVRVVVVQPVQPVQVASTSGSTQSSARTSRLARCRPAWTGERRSRRSPLVRIRDRPPSTMTRPPQTPQRCAGRHKTMPTPPPWSVMRSMTMPFVRSRRHLLTWPSVHRGRSMGT